MVLKLDNSLYTIVVKIIRKNSYVKSFFELHLYYFYKIFLTFRKFWYRGNKYKYFYHRYNAAFTNERVIEVPISRKILEKYKGQDILEVGNVLNRYYSLDHEVIDKHEKYHGVINQDVINFNPDKLYDLIISISTLEHVGFSMGEKKESGKFQKAVNNLLRLLRSGGLFFITLPMFYNEEIDTLIINNKMVFQEEYFMKRVSALNQWVQVEKRDALTGPRYNSKYIWGNLIYFGYYYS